MLARDRSARATASAFTDRVSDVNGAFRPSNVAAGVAILAGLAILVLPQQILSVVQVAIVAVAAAAGLCVLGAHVSGLDWISPLKGDSPLGRSANTRRHLRGSSLHLRGMAGVRYRIDGLPPLPPTTLRLLQRLVRNGLDLSLETELRPRDRAELTPLTLAVLSAAPPVVTGWGRWLRARPPDVRTVATVVNRVMDDLDRLMESRSSGRPSDGPARETT